MRAVARGREFAGSKAAFPALAAARRAGRRSARESRVRGMTLGIRGGGHAHGGVCARQMAGWGQGGKARQKMMAQPACNSSGWQRKVHIVGLLT